MSCRAVQWRGGGPSRFSTPSSKPAPHPKFFYSPPRTILSPPDKFFSTCLARNILVFVQQIRSGLVGFLSNIRHSNSYSRCLLFFKLHINFVVNRVVNRVHPLEVPTIWNLEWTAFTPPPSKCTLSPNRGHFVMSLITNVTNHA